MYKKYSLDEVKRKVINVLQNNDSGLSGVELADKTKINRMTITKYLNILYAIGLIKKKKMGSVNMWYLGTGVIDFEFPINYLEVQQRFMNAIIAGDEHQARRIMVSVINSNIEQIKILTDVILPTVNTLNELYNRGRLGKTEQISFLNMILEVINLLKFNIQTEKIKPNAYALFVAGSEDRIPYTAMGTVALQILGWNSSYIGNVEHYIDPFFDIDFQRYITKVWNNKKGLMIICIYSSQESTLRFLFTATKSIKTKLKAHVCTVLLTTPDLNAVAEAIGADYVAKDLQSLIDWTDRQYNNLK
jgi:Winged helix-turn-helix DNA-binding/B12 binding domain